MVFLIGQSVLAPLRTLLIDQGDAFGPAAADPFGLRRGGETGEWVGIENDGMLELVLEVVALGAESVVVLAKAVQLLAVERAVHGRDDPWRIAVECLPGDAGASGLPGDSTVGSIEDGGGVGDAKRWR